MKKERFLLDKRDEEGEIPFRSGAFSMRRNTRVQIDSKDNVNQAFPLRIHYDQAHLFLLSII